MAEAAKIELFVKVSAETVKKYQIVKLLLGFTWFLKDTARKSLSLAI